jgi:peptide chain release factor 1
MVPLDKLAQITQRFDYVEARLNAGGAPADIAALSREYSDLGPVIGEINAYRQALDDLAEAELMLADLHPCLAAGAPRLVVHTG